jgi:hypothetical protein
VAVAQGKYRHRVRNFVQVDIPDFFPARQTPPRKKSPGTLSASAARTRWRWWRTPPALSAI